MPELVVNEADVELVGIVGVNPFITNTSPSRLAMVAGHLGQHTTTAGLTPNRQSTGVSRELAKYVHDIRFPCDATVLKLIHKYPRTIGAYGVEENPLTTILYENFHTKQIGVINLEGHHCLHQYFGFRYVLTDVGKSLAPGLTFKQDTVIAQPPSITSDGDYMFGCGAYVALMSLQSGIEDGIRVSREFCLKNKTKGYGSRTLAWNKSTIPLNLFGTDENYKFVPDIGGYIGPDGLLFATRRVTPGRSLPLMSRKALKKSDFHDKRTYAIPNAKIIDIIVYKGNNNKSNLPKGMDEQCWFYYKRAQQYYSTLLDEYKRLTKERNANPNITPEFQTLLREALAYTQIPEKRHIAPMYSRQEIQEWLVEVIFEYDIIPGIGYKFTGLHGDKNIIVDVVDAIHMPTDAAGVRADIVKDGFSTIKRMNIGVVIEPAINASAENLQRKFIHETNNGLYNPERMFNELLGWYEIIAPLHYNNLLECLNMGLTSAKEEVDDFIQRGHHTYIPPNNPVDYMDACDELLKVYPPVYGPVTFTGINGERITTIDNVLIGEQYIMMLEKIGNTWNSVASAKLQHFGIPAKLSNADKYSSPTREGATRITGEGEIRLIYAVAEGITAADIIDQSMNPTVHRQIGRNILTQDKPTTIEEVIDRNLYPIGNGRVLNFVKHIETCSGKEFVLGDNND